MKHITMLVLHVLVFHGSATIHRLCRRNQFDGLCMADEQGTLLETKHVVL